MVAHLQIPINNRNNPEKQLNKQWQTHQEALNEVLWRVLLPLSVKLNLSAECAYYSSLCGDGNFRHCKAVLAAWLADCQMYSDLHPLKHNVCFSCECPKNELVDYVPPDNQ